MITPVALPTKALTARVRFIRMTPIVAVMITTCRRPDGLRRLLLALNQQVFQDAPPIVRLVVLDNDADESARAICDALRPLLRWPIHYGSESRRGISFARNAAIALALSTDPAADFLALIDDDELPAPTWLDEMLRIQRDHAAEVVAGPVHPQFEHTPPDWVVRGRFFEPRSHPDGEHLDYAFGGSVLWRASLCREGGHRFGEHYGLIGGSDSEFFTRLHRAGCKIVWAANAEVREFIPTERTNARWLVRRMFRTGNAGVLVARDLKGRTLRTHAILFCKALAWLAIGAAQTAAGIVAGKHLRVTGYRHIAYGLGILTGLTGRRFEEYRSAHDPAESATDLSLRA